MTFYEWLMNQTKRDDPVGDLARDAEADRDFPRGNTNFALVLTHLKNKHASRLVIRVFNKAYGEWLLYSARLRRESN